MKKHLQIIVTILISHTSFCQTLSLTQPSNYQVCEDISVDGLGIFDLTTKNDEILGVYSSSEYFVKFFESETDALSNVNPIINETNYSFNSNDIESNYNYLFARVQKISNPSIFGVTTLTTYIHSVNDYTNNPTDIVVFETNYDGSSQINLYNKIPEIAPNPSDFNFSFFESISDANNNLNSITNPTSYIGNNNQMIFIRVSEDFTPFCVTVKTFKINILDENNRPQISNPTNVFLCDSINDSHEIYSLNNKTEEILNGLNPSLYTINYFYSIEGATANDSNSIIPENYQFSNNMTIYVRVHENSNINNYSITNFSISLRPIPVANTVTNYLKYEYPFDGFATFDLTQKSGAVLGTQSSMQVYFYTSLADATNDLNRITSPSSYNNLSNEQTIWTRVIDPNTVLDCFTANISITTFRLIVVNQNNIVSIPDINFKNRLISNRVDVNNDNLIQQGEADSVSYLNLANAGITNTTGINKFNNLIELIVSADVTNFILTNKQYLKKINFYSGSFINVDISNNPLLEVLNFQGSEGGNIPAPNLTNPSISSINLNGCINLKEFNYKNGCSLSSFDGTGLVNLEKLYLNGNLIVNDPQPDETGAIYYPVYGGGVLNNININDCAKLKIFSANCQNLSVPNFSNLNQLEIIYLNNQYNKIFGNNDFYRIHNPIDLNLNGCTNLKELYMSHSNLFQNFQLNNLPSLEKFVFNNLKYIDNEVPEYLSNIPENNINLSINNCPNLRYLSCIHNYVQEQKIASLTLSNSLSIEEIYFQDNLLNANIDFNNFNNLEKLNLKNNTISLIGLNNCADLQTLEIQNNQLTSLDLSSCGNLQSVNCDNNNLEYISFKNNTNETKTFLNNPDLTYICADEAEQNAVQLILNLYEMYDTCNVGDYCSFNPNGNYNTISGNALYDNENDGCDTNDEVFQFLRVNLNDGTNSGSTFTNFEGDYVFYGNAGTFTLTPQLENPTYFNVSPATTQISFANANNNTATQDFCITPNGVHNDVEVVLAQVNPARPGFDAEYSLVYKNKGNQPLSGAVSVAFDDAKLDFVSSSTVPTSNTTGLLSWNYSNLLPFENRSITFTLNVNSPQETPAVNNGDVLAFTANITPLTGDEIPEDNTFVYNQIVVGSYDPNDIYCLEGESLDPNMIGKYLHYNVRFENTGTAAAENVVVATTINAAEYDLNSLQVLNASHNVYTRINGNLVEFIFENCQLAGSPSGGHGNILFKMKSLSSLQTNDDVTSNANIFFDYNFPIETNDATTIFETLSNQDFTKDSSVKVYPNPAKETVTISAKTNLSSITIYDAQGRIIQFVKANELEKTINISNLSNGIYILDIVSEKGRMVEKLVKE